MEGGDSFWLAKGVPSSVFSIYMAQVYPVHAKSSLALRRRKARLLAQLRPPPDALRGSFVEAYHKCGKPNCRCRQGHKHGPFFFLTQCLAPGRIQKLQLKTPEHQQWARAGIQAYHRFYDTLEELSQINAELLRRGDRLTPEAP